MGSVLAGSLPRAVNRGNVDPRIVRTKLFIKNGLLSVLEEKPLEDITLEEIAEAGYSSRNTISRYYRDRYDLMDDLCGTVLNKWDEKELLNYAGSEIPWEQVLTDICETIEEDRRFYELVVGIDRYPRFLVMLGSRISNYFVLLLSAGGMGAKEIAGKRAEIESAAAYFVGALRHWLRKQDRTTEQFAESLAKPFDCIWNSLVK